MSALVGQELRPWRAEGQDKATKSRRRSVWTERVMAVSFTDHQLVPLPKLALVAGDGNALRIRRCDVRYGKEAVQTICACGMLPPLPLMAVLITKA